MLKKYIAQKATSVLVAGAMALSVVAGIPKIPMLKDAFVAEAAPGEMFGNTNFANDVGLPWHGAFTPPADIEFDVHDGQFDVKILENTAGYGIWDTQFRHRGLTIRNGQTYTYKFDVKATTSGQIKVKVGNTSGSVEYWNSISGGEWENNIDIGTDWKTWSGTFTPNNVTGGVDEAAEFVFQFGKGLGATEAGDVGQNWSHAGLGLPNGTTISFRNLSLTGPDAYDHKPAYVRKEIQVNQVGYFPDYMKVATMTVGTATGQKGNLNTQDPAFTAAQPVKLLQGTTEVWSGMSTPRAARDADSDEFVHIIDFSEYKGEGKGFKLVCGTKESHTFDIGTDIYDSLFVDSFNYFYNNRSGVALNAQYITSPNAADLAKRGTLTVPDFSAGSPTAYASENPTRVGWYNTATMGGTNGIDTGESTLNIVSGWHDAGDYGKYVVNGGISVWTIMNAYEWDYLKNGSSQFAQTNKFKMPEMTSTTPDFLEEAKVQMDFMLSMQVKTGTYAGMAYHKISDKAWTMLAVQPGSYPEKGYTPARVIKPPSTQATLNLAATAAQAARLFKPYDAAYATKCETAAKAAYTAALANPTAYAPLDDNVGGGPYGDDDATDEFYWAACELWITTKDATYHDEMQKYTSKANVPHYLAVNESLKGGENTGTATAFNWGNVATLGTISLLLNADTALTATELATVQANFAKAGDHFAAMMDKQGYGLPYEAAEMGLKSIPQPPNGHDLNSEGYEWGSNSMVISNAMALAYAYEATGDDKYLNYAVSSLDYLLGRNPLDFSYVSGYGTNDLQNPHHRWWSEEYDSNFPHCPRGVLSGGPNSAMQDPWAKGMGFKVGYLAPQWCYTDSIEAWSVNECTINWNAPLAWMSGYISQVAAGDWDCVEKGAHKWGPWVDNADGLTQTRTCSVCGATETQDKPDHEHSWSGWTPNADGITETRTCSDCGETETRTISGNNEHDCATLGHKWGVYVPNAAGTEETRTCEVCGATETRPIIQGHTHVYGTPVVTTPATCTTAGVTSATCSCGDVQTGSVAALGHSWGDWVITGATETATCTVCGETQTRPLAESCLNGHSYGEWSAIVRTNCLLEGIQTRTCTACGATDSQTVPSLGAHTWNSGTVNADGSTTYTCIVCGATDTGKALDPNCTHAFGPATIVSPATVNAARVEMKTCTLCGGEGAKESVGYKLGDANGDDVVDIKDAVEILKYVAVLPNKLTSDAEAKKAAMIANTDDAKIGDAVEVLKYVADLAGVLRS